MKKILFILLSFLLLNNLWAQAPQNQKDQNLVKFQNLIYQHNGKTYLAIALKNEPGWHTYWKNPGDAGTPTDFSFKIKNSPVTLKALEWPAPKRYFEQGDLLAYGYENLVIYFFEIDKALEGKIVDAEIKWLVCKDICIPGKGDLKINLTKNFKIEQNLVTEQELAAGFQKIPQNLPWPKDLTLSASADLESKKIEFDYQLTSDEVSNEQNLLTPFPVTPFAFKRETLTKNGGELKAKLTADWEGEYQEPEMPLPKDGAFKAPINLKFLYFHSAEKKYYVISHELKNLNLVKKKEINPSPIIAKTSDENFSLLTYLFLAFLGGLILNLMPCVLPVISIKLYSLIKQSEESDQRILKHNLSYTLGVLTTFMGMATFIAVLKSRGEDVGWGFQLQHPGFLIFLILIIFLFILNLFGLFEFATPGGRHLGNKKLEDGFVGDFFGGVFATILSTPCSAPFLGTALTFAFTTTITNIFLIFFFIGLGLSSPFLLTGFGPGLIHQFPKPGIWMEHLKKFLGFTLILTMIWLYDVLLSVSLPSTMLTLLNISLGLIFFAFYVRRILSKSRWIFYLFLASAMISTTLTYNTLKIANSSVPTPTSDLWAPFSEESLISMKDKQVVFLDFTAEWCFTCKVNEKLVLETNSFKKFAQEQNLFLMKGDWTRRDDKITQFLKRYQIFGVPAYFIQKKNGEMISLGETISIDKIKKYLDN